MEKRKQKKTQKAISIHTQEPCSYYGLRGSSEHRKYEAIAFYEGWQKKKS